ncbi:hypothetical protein ACSBR2_004249 [Camellia fascicularis]
MVDKSYNMNDSDYRKRLRTPSQCHLTTHAMPSNSRYICYYLCTMFTKYGCLLELESYVKDLLYSIWSIVGVKGPESMERVHRNEEAQKGVSSLGLGSSPPKCEHKCRGCKPCNAIQVPTTTDHLGLHYANYEPEGWKCKCGTSFFNP